VEQLEADLVRFRELESLLRTTLVSAEQASAQMRDQARREAELILGEAHAEAARVQRDSLTENERLAHESRKLRIQLQDALAALGGHEATNGARKAPETAGPAEPAGEDAAETDVVEERSWYGLPDGSSLPGANAA
jgi:cell division septum initiation protein DivIVA